MTRRCARKTYCSCYSCRADLYVANATPNGKHRADLPHTERTEKRRARTVQPTHRGVPRDA